MEKREGRRVREQLTVACVVVVRWTKSEERERRVMRKDELDERRASKKGVEGSRN